MYRVEGTADSYGIGEVVAPQCTLFGKGMYNITREAAERGAKHLGIPFPYGLDKLKAICAPTAQQYYSAKIADAMERGK